MSLLQRLRKIEELVRLLEIRVYSLELKHRRSHGQELRSPGVIEGDVSHHDKDMEVETDVEATQGES